MEAGLQGLGGPGENQGSQGDTPAVGVCARVYVRVCVPRACAGAEEGKQGLEKKREAASGHGMQRGAGWEPAQMRARPPPAPPRPGSSPRPRQV